MSTTDPLYVVKPDSYYSVTRRELIDLIPSGTERLLDVGCGGGETGSAAMELKGVREVVGIELHPPAAAAAAKKIKRILRGDIEQITLDFPEEHFDCILCADVLEHAKDPWKILRTLRPFLRKNGILIASIPNFRHLHPLLKIIFNRYDYMESGILDKTHLRIFTLYTMRKMFEESGFTVDSVQKNYSSKWVFRFARIFSLGLLAPFTVYQYILVVRRNRNRP